MQELFMEMIMYIGGSLIHNGIFLVSGILIAAIMKVYVDPEKVKQRLLKKANVSIMASVAFGAFTPLCACGTMAIILGMLTTALPWGPIMAFLTASPLMSPDGFILNAGILGLKFAIALALASIIIGFGSGYATHLIEKKTNFLKNQTRFAKKQETQGCGCASAATLGDKSCSNGQLCCSTVGAGDSCQAARIPSSQATGQVSTVKAGTNISFSFLKKIKWREIGEALFNLGIKQILLYYIIFMAVGFFINRFVPSGIIIALFSGQNIFAVPLAALIGLPLYVNGESALPLIKALMAGGAGGGAMLAFLITGPGTSAGVIAGIAAIMKRRALILYVLFLLVGGIVLGYGYDLILALGV